MRYAIGFGVALLLAVPVLAGELDKDFSAKQRNIPSVIPAISKGDMHLQARGGSELDRENPAQAWARGWRWGGWGGRGWGWRGWGWRGWGWRGAGWGWGGWGWRGAGWRWGGWGWRGWGWPAWGWNGWGGNGWGWGGWGSPYAYWPSYWVSPGWGDCW
jgi:hypothetical protein